MDKPAAASELERRKQVRLRLRGDLSIAPQKYEGRTYYVVKDPVSLRYYRFKEQEHYLIQLMDGRFTLDEAQKEFEKRFRPERLTLEDLEGFAQQLLSAGLAQNESPQAGKQLFDRRKKRRRSEFMQAITNILYIKIPVFDPDKLLVRMLRYTRWIFTTWFMLLSVGVMLTALSLVLTHFETFREKLPGYQEFFSFKNVIYLWVALGVVKVIHEFGHGLSCKAFGGECHEMGLLFLCFSPCLYANVSDAWTLPSKWKRIIISFAGIYVELIIASLATFVWWNTDNGTFTNNLSLSLIIVCSVSTVMFNANPLMRYDGYYILADWLEIPNLRDRANRYLKNLFIEHCLGVEVQPEQYMALWRRILFVTYAIVSYIYRWVVTFSILWFMSRFLEPYKLGVISEMLALAAAGSMIGWPMYRLGKNIHKRGRLPDMKPLRVSLTASVFAAAILFFFLVPLPLSWVRQTCLVKVESESTTPVFVLERNSVLEEMYVKDGDRVAEGQPLARFSNREIEREMNEARTQHRINEELRVSYDGQKRDILDPQEQQRLQGKIHEAVNARDQAAQMMALLSERMKSLVLAAPHAGVVMMNLPHVEDFIGSRWEEGNLLSQPVLSVGDPRKLQALMPLPVADYSLLQEDVAALSKEGGTLTVSIRIQGRDNRTWAGRLETPLPQSQAEEIDQLLSNRNNGPVAVKTNKHSENQAVPQSPLYLVHIDIVDPDSAICAKMKAQVKIHCRNRSCAWWVWRKVSDLLDLGLKI